MVDISSTSEDFIDLLSTVGLATSFDIMHPGSCEEGLRTLGLLEGVEVGKCEVTFNVSTLIGLLGTFNGNDFDFRITATDEKGKSESETLMFHVN